MKKFLLYTLFLCTAYFMQAQTVGIVGPAANGWPSDGNPTDIMLTDNGDGTHSIDALTLTTGPAKFRENQDWAVSWGGDTFPSGPITNGDIPVQAGVYDIVLDLNNNTYTFTDVGTFTQIEIVGSAITGSSNPQMSTIDGVNYELSVTQFGDGDLQFQEVGTSNVYGANSFPSGTATVGGMAIPAQAGFYEVSFNLNTGDFSFNIPDVGIVGPAAAGWPSDTNPTDILMSSTDGDVYSLNNQTLTDGLLKFRQNLDWSVNWGGDTFPSGSFTSNDINVTAGTYDISFFRANQTYTFTSLSIEDLAFNQFKLYPNPTKDVWVFDNPGTSIKSIQIFDAFGKSVLEINPNSTQVNVSAQVLSQGLYLAKIGLVDGSETTVKIIKQ
ncbi:T9SS type A sorting domain-containing protein [Flavobacteriaceae bacterium 14752]|uniref:T9SS type A sorting domain-containing protein n=1 Tax=Mesohalobacter salilacus TaxID=2491711 RepID=UPI000F63BCA8|nr:T9SS C-terminal target domain-containing protein [Flavobacteriaceae bacterium 14752]